MSLLEAMLVAACLMVIYHAVRRIIGGKNVSNHR